MVGFLAVSTDSTKRTLIVALVLCLACSVVVAGAAVLLKPIQLENRALDRKRNILAVAGLLDPTRSVDAIYNERVETRIVELASGEYTESVNPDTYDLRKAARSAEYSVTVSPERDIANIKVKAQYNPVYLIKDENGALQTVILPVHGYGLWSTLYGFLALANDTRTVKGLKFYEHAETPGLGGEIDNAEWLAQWHGKVIYDDAWQPAIQVIKGRVDPNDAQAVHKVDGLAGATLTSRGVMHLLQYWLSDEGYGPYLARLRVQGVNNG